MKEVRMRMFNKFKEEKKMTNLESLIMKISKKEERRMIEMNKANKESWRRVMTEITNKRTENTEKLCGILIKSKDKNTKQPSKVIKPAKFPAWSKDMSSEVFEKQVKAWNEIN